MKKSSVGKRAIASACALTLALSMPVLAFAGDPDNAAQGDGIMVLADEPEAILNGTQVEANLEGNNSGLSVQPGPNANTVPTNEVNVTVNYEVDANITNQEQLDDAIADAGVPVLEEVTAPSSAFEAALNGNVADFSVDTASGITDKDEVINLISSEENYISKNTYEVNATGLKATTAVTVVYTTDANAQNVDCYAYYTIKDADGNTKNMVKKLTVAAGVATLALEDDFAGGVITFVLANNDTNPTTDGTAKVTSSQEDADGRFDCKYQSVTASKLYGNGQTDYSAFATADITQDTNAAPVVGALVLANQASPAGKYTALTQDEKDQFANVFSLDLTTNAAEADISNGMITIKVDPKYAGNAVSVFRTHGAGNNLSTLTATVGADGTFTVPAEGIDGTATTYTIAVAKTSTPVNPDVPVDPDQPVNPDNPTPVVPGDEDNGDGADNGAAEGNGVTATDKGTASPKTGIF